MKKVLIAYVSRTGKTERLAGYIAEGVRFTGNDAVVKQISEIKDEKALEGYDGYLFGCPTYHRDMTQGMKTFLFIAEKLPMTGKIGGAFGVYTHSGEAAPMIFDTMQHVFKMDMVDLGPLSLKEALVGTGEGMRAGQDYGKALGRKLGA